MIFQNQQDKEKCYGCYACANVCVKGCIKLEEDSEGFRYPQIDLNLCNDCGLCEKVCPIGRSSQELHREVLQEPKVVVGYVLNDEIRKMSASGGFSYIISKKVIEQGGVVFGVVGAVPGEIYHTAANTMDELKPFCGSKYVQSDIKETFKEAKKELKTGKQVLFSGTPCQIAGFYAFLGKKYDNLVTIDLICHGVPSLKVLRKYIEEQEWTKGDKIVWFGRDKSAGYSPAKYTIHYSNGEREIQLLSASNYRKGYLLNLFQRSSCYNCQYATIPRIGDYSLGDVFVDKDLTKKIDHDNIGGSLMTINTKLGERYFKEFNDEVYVENYSLSIAIEKSYHLTHSPKYHPKREMFFRLFEQSGFYIAVSVCLKKNLLTKIKMRLKGLVRCLS